MDQYEDCRFFLAEQSTRYCTHPRRDEKYCSRRIVEHVGDCKGYTTTSKCWTPLNEWPTEVISNKKEDTPMSKTQAYFCHACRGAFPYEECWFGAIGFAHYDRKGTKRAWSNRNDICLCETCYGLYLTAIAGFNIPVDEGYADDDA